MLDKLDKGAMCTKRTQAVLNILQGVHGWGPEVILEDLAGDTINI